MSETSFNPASRRLCADGSCVGLIGDDGRCRVCGRTEAEASAGQAVAAATVSGDDEPVVESVEASAAGDASAAGGFDAKRRLCDDGSCVGVVGDDGLCRVCGRRSE